MSKERDSQQRIAFVQLFAEVSASEDVPDEIHVVPTGKWQHPIYGEMEITSAHVAEFVQNFKDKVRLKIPITAGHDNGMSGGELPAVGWFEELIDRGVKGLYAVVSWTEEGKKLLQERAFKYFSPEFYEEYQDPQTQEVRHHVLVGGALTNKPYFKELKPVVAFSEPDIMREFSESMDLKTIVSKKPEELSDAEKAFVKEHEAELSAEQKTAFASVIGDQQQETDEEKAAREAQEAEEKAEQERQASELAKGKKIVMSEAEVAALRTAADAGAKALQKIEATERATLIAKLTFSKSNTAGRFFPKQSDKLEAFLKTLSEPQRNAFQQLVENMPAADASLFSEIGDAGAGGEKTVEALAKKVASLANEKITASGGKLKYSEAVKQVYTENPQLKKDYEEALEAND